MGRGRAVRAGLLLLACAACATTHDPEHAPPPDVCLRDDGAGLAGGAPPQIAIASPADGAVVTDYRGGGQGTPVSVRYEVRHLPCGGSSQVFVQQDGASVQVHTNRATRDAVDLPLHFTPGRYRLEVAAYDRAGRERARASVSFEVELPEYARHVRVMGTHDTLAAILDALAHKRPGAYLRFGDGDIQLASGSHDQMQSADARLMREAQAALAMEGAHVFKGLMVNSYLFGGVEEGMADGNHLISDALALGLVEMASRFWRPVFGSRVQGLLICACIHV